MDNNTTLETLSILREINGFYIRLIETSPTMKVPEQINCKKSR